MAKVLLLGPSFYGYTRSVETALHKMQFEVEVLEWITENDLYSFKDKLKVKFGTSRDYLIKKNRTVFNNKVISNLRNKTPDYILVIRGAMLDRATLEEMRGIPTILWMMDSIFLIKQTLDNVDLYNKIFVFEKEDIGLLKQHHGIDAIFLPLALDENIYYPIASNYKPIDILFVGALYPNRVAFLNNLIKKFPDKNINIYGFYFSKIRDLKRYFFRNDKRYYLNKTVTPQKLNILYSKTKLCLNIHHTQSQYGVNQRFFEISGARSLQVCDKHGFITDNFDENKILIFETEEQLHKIVEQVLNDEIDKTKEIQSIYKKVLEEHTFTKRVEFIFETVFS